MLAEQFRQRADVRVIVISEGAGNRYLQKRKAETGLENLVLMPYQPYEQLPQVLAAADVLLALLEASAGEFSVPGKVLSHLCAQRPTGGRGADGQSSGEGDSGERRRICHSRG